MQLPNIYAQQLFLNLCNVELLLFKIFLVPTYQLLFPRFCTIGLYVIIRKKCLFLIIILFIRLHWVLGAASWLSSCGAWV